MAPNIRTTAKEQTRKTLLEVGFALAETTGFDGLTVNAITDAAGVAKGTFFHHFKDRASYLVALHQQFHDRILERIQVALAGVPSGGQRLAVIAATYLDACLRNRGVRALILEARGLLAIQAEITRRNEAIVGVLTSDFIELGWPSASVVARLWIAATVECALLELEVGRPCPQARSALLDFAAAPRSQSTERRS